MVAIRHMVGQQPEPPPQQQQQQQQQTTTPFKPSLSDVVVAVKSLYEDKLKPYGRIVLRRVGEQAAEKAAASIGPGANKAELIPRVDTKRLRRICETGKQLHVESEDGGEYSVYLVGRAPLFVDANSCFDPYPVEFWAEVSTYFEALTGSDAMLPGGRYACAQMLAARGLPFLEHRCLGELCHIIALAVSQKKILGYADGHIVPFMFSETGLKEHCAAWQTPVCKSNRSVSQLPVANWEEARSCLRELLRTSALEGPGNVPLPNVKRLFISRFNLELSETALGYSRVYDLLHDQRFHDVCRIHRQGNTYVVVPGMVLRTGCASERQPMPGAYSCLSTSPLHGMPPPIAPPAMLPVPPCSAAAADPSQMVDLTQNICLMSDHLKHDGSDESTVDGVPDEKGCLGSTLNSLSSSDDTLGSTLNSLSISDEVIGLPLVDIHTNSEPLVEVLTSSDFEDSPFLPMGSFSDMLARAEEREEVATLCADDACGEEEVEEENDITVIRNTFIHFSPTSGSRRRCRSLPKDMRIHGGKRASSPTPSLRSWPKITDKKNPSELSTDDGAQSVWEFLVGELRLHGSSAASDVDTETTLWNEHEQEWNNEWKTWGHSRASHSSWDRHSGQWKHSSRRTWEKNEHWGQNDLGWNRQSSRNWHQQSKRNGRWW